jgi:uncharacterized protein YjbJ (UPF0337 family)
MIMDDFKRDSVGEEASAFGDRVKGNVKDAAGAVTGNRSLEREGEAEASSGAARQRSNRMVTGLFDDRESAERAYQSAAGRGYGKDDLNLIMSDETRNKHFAGDKDGGDTELGTKAWEGAGKGAAIGGGVGATIAAIAAIGTSLALPGIGLLIAGPIAAALAGGGAGALTGGLIGALVGSGIPEEHAAEYEEGIKKGGVFMGVNPRSDEDAEYFENEWKSHGKSVHAVGTGAGAVGGAATGAAVGTAVAPGVGTAVGGVVGGVAGAVGGHEVAEHVNPDDEDRARR